MRMKVQEFDDNGFSLSSHQIKITFYENVLRFVTKVNTTKSL